MANRTEKDIKRYEMLGILSARMYELENEFQMCKSNYDAVRDCVSRNTNIDYLKKELSRLEAKAKSCAVKSSEIEVICKECIGKE